jgi:hypothetical protein
MYTVFTIYKEDIMLLAYMTMDKQLKEAINSLKIEE